MTESCAVLELHKSQKMWFDLSNIFTISVVLIPCVNSQVCAKYVRLLPKYLLSQFNKFKILKLFSTTFLIK